MNTDYFIQYLFNFRLDFRFRLNFKFNLVWPKSLIKE